MPNIPPSDDAARRTADEAAKARQEAAQRDRDRQAPNTPHSSDASQRASTGQLDPHAQLTEAQQRDRDRQGSSTSDRGQSPDRTSADPSGRAHGQRGDFVLRPAADVTLAELAAAIEAAGIRVPGADVDKMAAKVSRHFADARGKV